MPSLIRFRILRGLGRHPGRIATMMAGITLAISFLLTVDSVGAATRRLTMAQVKNMLGTFDTVLVRPGAGKTRGMVSLSNVPPTLTFADADAISALPLIRQTAVLQNAFDIEAQVRDRQHTPAVFGVSANWLDLRGDRLARGKFFTPAQMGAEERAAVLGGDVVAALFPNEDPLGKSVRLGGVPFQVQGVLAARGAGPGGFSLDDLILIPVTTASRRLFNRDFLTMAVAQVRAPGENGAALAAIRELLRRRHHIADAGLDDFTLTDPSAVAEQLAQVGSRLESILRGAALMALALGAVAIVALMVLGVSERRAEIGVRRAAGASRSDIVRQFLTEAGVLGACAVALGLALGAAGIAAAAAWQHEPVLWSVFASWREAVAVGAAALAVGVACGILPAIQASRLDPAVALRS
ncbi:MAG TPA: ABC transporter permease [Terriglobales bacterium]|nr:ABC transporter permease [Terriglobales bacterium]